MAVSRFPTTPAVILDNDTTTSSGVQFKQRIFVMQELNTKNKKLGDSRKLQLE